VAMRAGKEMLCPACESVKRVSLNRKLETGILVADDLLEKERNSFSRNQNNVF